jgi:hypothetical protein
MRGRYKDASPEKAGGATYTPKVLSDFVAAQIVDALPAPPSRPLRILDPAVGDAQLLVSLVEALAQFCVQIEAVGFDTDPIALVNARERLANAFPDVAVRFERESFPEYVLEHFSQPTLFGASDATYDLIIANPPYVRTQLLGAASARVLAEQFGLQGRVDLYFPFLLGICRALAPGGVAGVIVSNRFMTTRSGASVRARLRQECAMRHVWDLGDTRLFEVAVLPSVLLLSKDAPSVSPPRFTSIYKTEEPATTAAAEPIEALRMQGVVAVRDGRRFRVTHGSLDFGSTPGAVWRIATDHSDSWLATVRRHTWGTFRDIGKVRVGVKTCADTVFIRDDWPTNDDRPELLRPATRHYMGRRFRPLRLDPPLHILYPHEIVDGRRRAVDLSRYPRSRRYLEEHRAELESRSYVIESGREWYEIWVPQNPGAWSLPKLVFRDIAQEPMFWIDTAGTVVNGDCYWLASPDEDLLWLAAGVANSTFAETFYDHSFHNKLYAGRRRFITQYVEHFPVPDPHAVVSKDIVVAAKRLADEIETPEAQARATELERLVWRAFGLPREEARGERDL